MKQQNKQTKKTKLRHGRAYSFIYNGKCIHALYSKHEKGYEFEAINRYYNLTECTDIIKL